MHTCMYITHMCVCTYECACVHAFACMIACVRVCVKIYVCLCTCAHELNYNLHTLSGPITSLNSAQKEEGGAGREETAAILHGDVSSHGGVGGVLDEAVPAAIVHSLAGFIAGVHMPRD